MSTKWNNNQRLQKTPKVCKKPPDPLPLPAQAFQRYPLQAFASWKDPFSPLDALITGNVLLAAQPSINFHAGIIRGSTHSLELDLEWRPVAKEFVYRISLLLGAIVLDDRTVIFTHPIDELPFVAGMFTWEHDGSTAVVRSKIFS